MTEPVPSPARVRVWDVPTRLVHWLLVLLVTFSWWSAETGRMEWHRWSGYTLLGLVIFRLYWGLAGSSTARFTRFVRGPRAILGYLKGGWTAVPGHNPLGALSVVALLALLAIQVVLGLFAVDVDGIESGPLSTYVSFEAGRAAAHWHEDIFDVLSALILLHIVAVMYYVFFRKQSLVAAMVHGRRAFPEPQPAPMQSASVVRLLLGIVLAVALTWWVARAFQV
ncbi:MAG TPA: cytochrome b/b6 domain-containing protein [Steroidobacteraceae bacterium]|nr:cytochrome b/b6 domain-containing protein [Steroidobacteraceae bacterium]